MIRLKNIVPMFMLIMVTVVASGCAAKDLDAANHGTKSTNYDRPGFVTGVEDGRLWVFVAASKEGQAYAATKSKPARHVVRPAAGPDGMTIRAPEFEVIDAYLMAKAGFVTGVEDGRLWVFKEGTQEADAYIASRSKPARHVVRPGAGPNGMTIRAPEFDIIDAYLAAK